MSRCDYSTSFDNTFFTSSSQSPFVLVQIDSLDHGAFTAFGLLARCSVASARVANLRLLPGINEHIHFKPHRDCYNFFPFGGKDRITSAAPCSRSCFIQLPLRTRPHHIDSCWKNLHLLEFNFKRFFLYTISTFSKISTSVSHRLHIKYSFQSYQQRAVQEFCKHFLISRPHCLCRP